MEDEMFSPYTNERLYSTRLEVIRALWECLAPYADEFDVEAIADVLVAWHTCYVERDGEVVEWLPGNGFYIRQFTGDMERGDAQAFWDLVADHACPTAMLDTVA